MDYEYWVANVRTEVTPRVTHAVGEVMGGRVRLGYLRLRGRGEKKEKLVRLVLPPSSPRSLLPSFIVLFIFHVLGQIFSSSTHIFLRP